MKIKFLKPQFVGLRSYSEDETVEVPATISEDVANRLIKSGIAALFLEVQTPKPVVPPVETATLPPPELATPPKPVKKPKPPKQPIPVLKVDPTPEAPVPPQG